MRRTVTKRTNLRLTSFTAVSLLPLLCACGAKPSGSLNDAESAQLLEDVADALPGHRIVSSSQQGLRTAHIWVTDVDGTNPLDLTPDLEGVSAYPEWGPQARWIYFVSTASGAWEAWRVPADGSAAPERLTDIGRDVRNVVVSADGELLALSVMSANSVGAPADLSGYSADLYVVPMEDVLQALELGSFFDLADYTAIRSDPQDAHVWHEQQEFAPAMAEDGGAPWIAYGRTVNYDNDSITQEALWLVRADGSEAHEVLGDESMPRWTSDGASLVGFGFTHTDLNSGETRSFAVRGLKGDAGSVSLSPDGEFVLFEESDRNRYAAIARVSYDSVVPSGYAVIGANPAYEPRFSPVPVP